MESNLAELLTRARLAEPGKTALSEADSGRSVTWRELDDLAERVARGLFGSGLVAGVRVALVLRNRVEAVAGYLGVLRAGMVAVPLDVRASADDLERVVAETGARLVVCDEVSAAAVRTAVRRSGAAAPRVVVVAGDREPDERTWEELVGTGDAADQQVPVRADPDALAALLWTSGSSGQPRAAMLTHRALLANVGQVAAASQPMVHSRDVVLGALPLHHSYGLAAVLGQVLRQHARLVLTDRMAAEATLDLVEDEAVTVAPLAPADLAGWLAVHGLEDRLGPLRLVLSGSAALGAELAQEFARRSGLAVHQGYGLTECGPVVTSTLVPEAAPAAEGDDAPPVDLAVDLSVGRPLPGVELRLADERGGAPDDGDPGQILVRGPQLFSGYWPDGADGPGADGWWATGDVGLLDASGDLHLIDRVGDVVVVSGFPVFPSEVEEVVSELAEVSAVAVVGVDDPGTGSAVVAFVAGTSDDTASLEARVREHCERRLARFKVPARVLVVDELPRTPTGKIQRGRLREAAGAGA